VVHELYGTSDVREAVVGRFGAEVAPGGVIDRGALARRAFSSDENRRWLEAQLWPLVGEQIARWREQQDEAAQPPRAAVVEVPLLFESGMEGLFDVTVAVIAGEGLRAQRAQSRGHEALAERGARQLPQQEKARRATYVAVNDGTVEELERTLSSILEKLEQHE